MCVCVCLFSKYLHWLLNKMSHVIREAKKDQVGRQAYRLLTSIHQTFEQMCEKILATDRARREIAEHEKKLAVMTSQSLLQPDLEVIVKENENLERHLQDSGN